MVTKTVTKTAKPAASAKPVKTAKTPAAPKKTLTPRRAAKTAQPALAKPFTSEELTEVFKLIKGATSVELKLSVPLTDQRATIKAIGLDPVEAQPRQAFFFDTPDLALNRAGVVVRARRIQGGDADTVVKLRPVDPSTIDPELRRSAAFKIEVDAMPGGCKLFSKEQRAFYDAHAPAGITMDKLVILGPTFLLKAKHQPKAKNFDRPITLEMWLYPDGSRVMELSTKALPKEAFQVAADFKSYLTSLGIVLGADQAAKTRTSLEFFSARLKEEGVAG